jgi:hypothetical protein
LNARLGLGPGLGLRLDLALFRRSDLDTNPGCSRAETKHTLTAFVQHLDLHCVAGKIETRQPCGDRRIDILSGNFYHWLLL